MVDRTKRKALLSLGGVMAVPFVPSMALAANDNAVPSDASARAASHLFSGREADLNISLVLHGSPMMKVTNTSAKLKILRRIQPGVVKVEEKSYDLNQSLIGSAYAIGPGATRLIPISEVSSADSESVLAARYTHQPLSMVSITSSDQRGRVLELTKLLYA